MAMPLAEPTPTLPVGVTRDYLLHHRLCPSAVASGGRLVLAVAPGVRPAAISDLACTFQRDVTTNPVTDAELERLIERLTSRAERSIELSRVNESEDEASLAADVRDLVNQPPVIRFVNLLVRDAYDANASDIHLEATRDDLLTRFRLDGVLVPGPDAPPQLHQAVISRLKLLAELDISERRRPQDGRIRVRLEDRELDLRVSTIPTVHGESVVLRLLDRGGRPVSLDELGLAPDLRHTLESLVARPHGMLLVTGPTGSGKTTTLYAALQRRDGSQEKIITVEDPVEYQLTGVTQVPVQRQAGVTFASALRAILRQDPDVVMIGEMRDAETAEIAVQAAMTGHLVLSTLHTNDALRAVPRLVDLGVPEYLIAGTVEGILAQRLVRAICEECRSTYEPDLSQTAAIAGRKPPRLGYQRGNGCAVCRGTGYRGRVGIFELLLLTEPIKRAIADGVGLADIRTLAEEQGFRTMQADGWAKIEAGITTVEEVFRVVHE